MNLKTSSTKREIREKIKEEKTLVLRQEINFYTIFHRSREKRESLFVFYISFSV